MALAISLAWGAELVRQPNIQGVIIMTVSIETLQRTAVSLFGALILAAIFVGSAVSVVPVA